MTILEYRHWPAPCCSCAQDTVEKSGCAKDSVQKSGRAQDTVEKSGCAKDSVQKSGRAQNSVQKRGWGQETPSCAALNVNRSAVTSTTKSLPSFLESQKEAVLDKLERSRRLLQSARQDKEKTLVRQKSYPNFSHMQNHRHSSCPVSANSRRKMLYQCPRCHRLRNFGDDRHQFIMYGVTTLWPTPPPAPPTPPSCPLALPQNPLTSASASSCLEGAYNICRVFRTSSAKLHTRSPQKKKHVIIPTPSLALARARSRNKKRESSTGTRSADATSKNESVINLKKDLNTMVSLLKRYVTPRDRRWVPSNPSNSATFRSSASIQSPMPGRTVSDSGSPRITKKPQGELGESIRDKKTLGPSPVSSCPSKTNSLQLLPQAKLDSWARRLRSGVYLRTTNWVVLNSDRTTIVSSVSQRSSHRKRLSNKAGPRRSQSKAKKTSNCLKTITAVSPENIKTRKDNKSSGSKSSSYSTSPNAPRKKSAARRQSLSPRSDKQVSGVSSQKRSLSSAARRNTRTRKGEQSGELEDSDFVYVKPVIVKSQIEAVKIENTTAEVPPAATTKRKGSKRARSKRKSASKTFQSAAGGGEDLASPIHDNPRNARDAETILEDFRNQLKMCQGKGNIKPAHLEVIAYLEGKRSEAQRRAVPKTYQQMGLAPLTRSPSSQNLLSFKCALSDTNLACNPASLLITKKKKKKAHKSPARKSDKVETQNIGDEVRVTRVLKSVRKKKSKSRHRRKSEKEAAAATSPAVVVAAPGS